MREPADLVDHDVGSGRGGADDFSQPFGAGREAPELLRAEQVDEKRIGKNRAQPGRLAGPAGAEEEERSGRKAEKSRQSRHNDGKNGGGGGQGEGGLELRGTDRNQHRRRSALQVAKQLLNAVEPLPPTLVQFPQGILRRRVWRFRDSKATGGDKSIRNNGSISFNFSGPTHSNRKATKSSWRGCPKTIR